MRRCFQLAEHGLGSVSPNPMVGCVIVKDGKVIGEGFHRVFGESHAEVNAIESVADKSLLKGATLYVNLEPCSHYGKTPPCADRIIECGIEEVFISASDPSEKVAGKGIEKMQKAGLSVHSGLLKEREEQFNVRFRTYHLKKRPYIILKWAQTADGFMDVKRDEGMKGQFRISNEESKRLLHKWRSEEDSILIGTNTAINDDPSIDVRLVEGKNPLRLVMDLKSRLSENLKLLTDGKPTVIYTEAASTKKGSVEWVTVKTLNGVLHEVLADLFKREVQSVIVEGGQQVLKSFIDADLWDEARVFESPKELNEGLEAVTLPIPFAKSEDVGDNKCFYYYREA